MKIGTICRYVLAIGLVALATLIGGCHGFSANW